MTLVERILPLYWDALGVFYRTPHPHPPLPTELTGLEILLLIQTFQIWWRGRICKHFEWSHLKKSVPLDSLWIYNLKKYLSLEKDYPFFNSFLWENAVNKNFQLLHKSKKGKTSLMKKWVYLQPNIKKINHPPPKKNKKTHTFH